MFRLASKVIRTFSIEFKWPEGLEVIPVEDPEQWMHQGVHDVPASGEDIIVSHVAVAELVSTHAHAVTPQSAPAPVVQKKTITMVQLLSG